jgi:hypothetical protein
MKRSLFIIEWLAVRVTNIRPWGQLQNLLGEHVEHYLGTWQEWTWCPGILQWKRRSYTYLRWWSDGWDSTGWGWDGHQWFWWHWWGTEQNGQHLGRAMANAERMAPVSELYMGTGRLTRLTIVWEDAYTSDGYKTHWWFRKTSRLGLRSWPTLLGITSLHLQFLLVHHRPQVSETTGVASHQSMGQHTKVHGVPRTGYDRGCSSCSSSVDLCACCVTTQVFYWVQVLQVPDWLLWNCEESIGAPSGYWASPIWALSNNMHRRT